jgi:capsular polysaccharide transport system permease protein
MSTLGPSAARLNQRIAAGVQRPRSALAHGFEVQCRVTGAIIMREMHTRFGRDNIGYLWLFLEPMLLASAISGIHLAVHARLAYGMEVIPFYLSGYTPYLMFRQIVNRASATIESNRTLLYHRQITLWDLLFARALLDLIGTTLAMLMLVGLATALGLSELPDRPIYVFGGLFLMFWISLGFSLPICALSVHSSAVERFVHPITYIMMPFSGVFFIAETVPPNYREILMWGPVIHITQLVRMGQFGTFDSKYCDIPYVVIWCVGLTFIGLLSLRMVKSRVFDE